jgi:hypothetical protein
MKAYGMVVLGVAVGLVAPSANAVQHHDRLPGAVCLPVSATAAADISYGTTGRVTNNSTTTSQTVICPVPLSDELLSSDSVQVTVVASTSIACTLRLNYWDGSAAKSHSVTAPIASMSVTGSGLTSTDVTANVRCAIPAGANITSLLLYVDGFIE